MNVAQLDHINFTVSDFDESVEWYKRVFNFNLVEKGVSKEGHRWGILRSGDSMLAITEFKGRRIYSLEDQHQTYHFGLRLVSREAWEKVLQEQAIPVYYGSPIAYPHSTSWYVKDPSGHEVEVAIWKDDTVRFFEL